jgi:hypothetical protein
LVWHFFFPIWMKAKVITLVPLLEQGMSFLY